MAPTRSSARKCHMSFTWNRKAEMIKHSVEGMLKARDRLKSRPLLWNSQVMSAKEKVLKENLSAVQWTHKWQKVKQTLLLIGRKFYSSAQKIKLATRSFKLKPNPEQDSDFFQGTWVAQLVVCPTSAQVMISRFVGLSPMSGSVLAAQSLEPAADSVSPSLSAPLLLSLSQK